MYYQQLWGERGGSTTVNHAFLPLPKTKQCQQRTMKRCEWVNRLLREAVPLSNFYSLTYTFKQRDEQEPYTVLKAGPHPKPHTGFTKTLGVPVYTDALQLCMVFWSLKQY